MKIPIAVTVAIVAVAAGIGWKNHQEIAAANWNHNLVMARATDRGISLDAGNRFRMTKHPREGREAEAKRVHAEWLALAEDFRKSPRRPGEPLDKVLLERDKVIEARLSALDAEQFKIIIAGYLTAPELDDGERRGGVTTFTWKLAKIHPREFLMLFAETPELFDLVVMGLELQIRTSLSTFAKEDLPGAVEWIETNGKKFPKLIDDNSRNQMLDVAAKRDPALAFKLIDGLNFRYPELAAYTIAGQANNASQRTATVAALRDYLTSIDSPEMRLKISSQTFGQLASSAAREGFEAGSRWLLNAGLTDEELNLAAKGLEMSPRGELPDKDVATGKWIQWIGDHAEPSQETDQRIRYLVQEWTKKDHRAAAFWLASAQDNPIKAVAVSSFAETVAAYEPETAVKWAFTIPAGAERDQALKSVYTRWPRKSDADKAAAEAFKAEHGIR